MTCHVQRNPLLSAGGLLQPPPSDHSMRFDVALEEMEQGIRAWCDRCGMRFRTAEEWVRTTCRGDQR